MLISMGGWVLANTTMLTPAGCGALLPTSPISTQLPRILPCVGDQNVAPSSSQVKPVRVPAHLPLRLWPYAAAARLPRQRRWRACALKHHPPAGAAGTGAAPAGAATFRSRGTSAAAWAAAVGGAARCLPAHLAQRSCVCLHLDSHLTGARRGLLGPSRGPGTRRLQVALRIPRLSNCCLRSEGMNGCARTMDTAAQCQ